jgi:hypothetical protein
LDNKEYGHDKHENLKKRTSHFRLLLILVLLGIPNRLFWKQRWA